MKKHPMSKENLERPPESQKNRCLKDHLKTKLHDLAPWQQNLMKWEVGQGFCIALYECVNYKVITTANVFLSSVSTPNISGHMWVGFCGSVYYLGVILADKTVQHFPGSFNLVNLKLFSTQVICFFSLHDYRHFFFI